MRCQEKCIEEEQIEEQTCNFLKSIYVGQRELDNALFAIEEERRNERSAEETLQASVENALEQCRRNLDNLTKLRYRELIGEEEFIRQRAELAQEERKLNERLKQLKTENWIEPSRNLFLFSNRAVFWLTHGTAEEKRLILSTVGSNLTVSDKKISIDAKEPFQIIQETVPGRNWCAIVNDVRTLFEKNPGIVIPLLAEPSAGNKSALEGYPKLS